MDALLVIDVQNDFCPGGKLAVNEGDQVVRPLNDLMDGFEHIVLTQDWHPAAHLSFASNHVSQQAYDTIEMKYGEQVLWPDHCLQNSEGSDFHPELDTQSAQLILRKGFRREIDSYSAFFENDHSTPTGLHGFLKEFGIDRLFLGGLATDFCVKWSALDARDLGYEVFLITDAVRGIDLDNSVEIAFNEMKEAGVKFILSTEVKRIL